MLDGAATCTPPMLASMKRRHFLSAGAASMVGVGAWADAQPPIRLLAGFQAGGSTDMLARIVAAALLTARNNEKLLAFDPNYADVTEEIGLGAGAD